MNASKAPREICRILQKICNWRFPSPTAGIFMPLCPRKAAPFPPERVEICLRTGAAPARQGDFFHAKTASSPSQGPLPILWVWTSG